MKPAPFRLHRPESMQEAVRLLAQHGDDAKVIAGGQSLLPLLALRLTHFEDLVDLNLIEALFGASIEGDDLLIGAMTRQADAELSPDVGRMAPLVVRALRHVGHFQIRNRGTVGGSLAHADPASELPAVALAVGASMEIRGPSGFRTVPADAFFVDRWTTALDYDELLVSCRIPKGGNRRGFAIEEVARRHGDFAMAGVACAVSLIDGRVANVGISLFGVDRTPLLCPDPANELVGRAVDELGPPDYQELAVIATRDLDPPDDTHATGSYRRAVTALLVSRALRSALQEAQGA